MAPGVPERFNPPFQRVLGIQMGVGDDGAGKAWVDIDPETHWGSNSAHGGLVGTLADVASGVAIGQKVGDPFRTIEGTIELKVNFLRKASEGDLTATARLVHLGRRLAVTEVEITNKGSLCAKAIATFMLRREGTEVP